MSVLLCFQFLHEKHSVRVHQEARLPVSAERGRVVTLADTGGALLGLSSKAFALRWLMADVLCGSVTAAVSNNYSAFYLGVG